MWEVLRRHPDCVPGRSPIWEDYLLKNAHHLERFATEAQSSWDRVWGSTEHLRPQLLVALGEALTTFLSIDPQRRTVTKSPTIANLDLFFDVFPRAHLLLLIRDGRDVAASGMKTFGWSLEEAARGWALGAAEISRFADSRRDENVKVVRFEDLVLHTESSVSEILSFLDLDVASFDLEVLEEIPVRGSSAYLGPGRTEVNWDVLSRPDGFTPMGRWKSWSTSEIAAFEDIAGTELEHFGYGLASGAT